MGQAFLYGNGSGGTGGTLTITAPAGVTVTISKDGKTKTKTADPNGQAVFKGLDSGTWTVVITDGSQTSPSRQVVVTADYDVTMSFFAASIVVTYPKGSTCTCSDGTTTLTAPDTSGSWVVTVPNAGTWKVSCTNGTDSDSKNVPITTDEQSVTVTLAYNTIPEFTYTGDYEIVDDDDNLIITSDGDWKIRLLTSGTLTFSELNGAADGIDVFCVGGGGKGGGGGSTGEGNTTQGGGGGGGYTKTSKDIKVSANADYSIAIGSTGSKSSGFGVEASGGSQGGSTGWGGVSGCVGGAGGSGGGATGKSGGTDGGDGGSSSISVGGKGQGTTTREFGESSGRLYASGGRGGGGAAGAANTGDGGGGKYGGGGSGGSGVVVIRNKR